MEARNGCGQRDAQRDAASFGFYELAATPSHFTLRGKGRASCCARRGGRMNIGELCTREVYIVNAAEPLSQAVHEMRKRNVGCVIVVEQKGDRTVPIGIVTDRDIVRALPDYPNGIGTACVADVMTRAPLTRGHAPPAPARRTPCARHGRERRSGRHRVDG
jgi:hypothetical protein